MGGVASVAAYNVQHNQCRMLLNLFCEMICFEKMMHWEPAFQWAKDRNSRNAEDIKPFRFGGWVTSEIVTRLLYPEEGFNTHCSIGNEQMNTVIGASTTVTGNCM